ncbi:hypothetical protein H0H81_003643 [Sphagnurus paluster]|uniref:DUF6699 domain-containing protein n=1 Tax=Sphagnurus paluster TaxID=117069 RepID=A0A9P7FYQ9_9AGAR|nr:hypothetical protein H0H81_003643 [Sphagnurus paluster]
MTQLTLHPLLAYSQHELVPGLCTALMWDMRDPPTAARPTSAPHLTLSAHELAEPATAPPMPSLRIMCGVFPQSPDPASGTDWTMEVRATSSSAGLTLGDVLGAVYEGLAVPLVHAEWDALCEKQQKRIGEVFDRRWREAADPAGVRARGVIRADCLLFHTLFGGLAMSFETSRSCVLIVRRPPPVRN